ncbi:MAG: glycoside hydrolase family 27 protein [Clostridia bacterium]|nr:glycoside hydrolase family 27 protein [Clostridia bacterium]
MVMSTPPMGWNSWNTFNFHINETIIRETAEAIVSKGLKDAGYEYVVIDDWWSLKERDKDGRLVANPELFPSGMKALSDYVHSLGLKFGMYSCAGLRTCGGFPASFDREFLDAQTFADWGVDYLKYDFCFFPHNAVGRNYYNRMSMALKATGRDIVFSACNWGADEVEKWIRSTGAHLYRSTGDIFESFSSVKDIATSQWSKEKYSAPGCYDDLDMLICGMDGQGDLGHPNACSDTDYKTHFALWCMMGSPLMLGNDVRVMRPEMVELVTNKDLLRIDADAECRNPIILTTNSELTPTYFKHLSNNEFALAMFNFSDDAGNGDFRPWEIGLTRNAGFSLDMREVFTGEELHGVNDFIWTPLAPHDCKVFIGKYTV